MGRYLRENREAVERLKAEGNWPFSSPQRCPGCREDLDVVKVGDPPVCGACGWRPGPPVPPGWREVWLTAPVGLTPEQETLLALMSARPEATEE